MTYKYISNMKMYNSSNLRNKFHPNKPQTPRLAEISFKVDTYFNIKVIWSTIHENIQIQIEDYCNEFKDTEAEDSREITDSLIKACHQIFKYMNTVLICIIFYDTDIKSQKYQNNSSRLSLNDDIYVLTRRLQSILWGVNILYYY